MYVLRASGYIPRWAFNAFTYYTCFVDSQCDGLKLSAFKLDTDLNMINDMNKWLHA